MCAEMDSVQQSLENVVLKSDYHIKNPDHGRHKLTTQYYIFSSNKIMYCDYLL